MRVVDQSIALLGGAASGILVRLPLQWRLAVMRGGQLAATELMKTRVFRQLYQAQNRAHRSQVGEATVSEELTAVSASGTRRPDDVLNAVALFYSGGADSTYSAVLLAQAFSQVHLLTFTHDGIANTHKVRINADRLIQRFGDRIVYRVIDSSALWRRLYLEPFAEDRAKYGAFLNTGACECCYLCWNAIAAVYSQRNGIQSLASGIDRDHSGFMYSASDEGIERMVRRHAQSGIKLFMPVYDEPHTDERLFEMGITAEPHTKRPYQFYTTATTQGTCEFGLGHRFYAQYAAVRRTAEQRRATAGSYFDEKLRICRAYVADAIEHNLPISFVS
jgi:hypothetical protein